jgi:hypothetical protein
LLALCAVSATLGNRVTDRVNTNFAFAAAKMEKIREAHGLETRPVNALLKTKLEGALEQAAPPSISGWISGLDCEDEFDWLRGFAYGLQFSAATQGMCYQSIDETINASEDFTRLAAKFYDPTVWADMMLIANNYLTYISAISANCDLQKLMNTFTTSPSTLIPQLAARLGGGVITEIPNKLMAMQKAKTCYIASQQMASLFSLFFDYYI